MSEGPSKDDFSPVKNSNVTFPLGRGHGPEIYENEGVSEFTRCYGRGRALANLGLDRVHTTDSAIGFSVGPAASSTPIIQPDFDRVVTPESLGGIISDLAQKIGESISASLNLAHQPSPVQSNPPCHSQHSSDGIDKSSLKVIVQQDAPPPPFFRGDKSDSFTVHEWEDMMYSYLNRMKCRTQTDVSDLILSRLAGKARDVVKVSLRSRPELSASEFPSAVFDILKRNFSELSYSNMPMADFYNTVPRADESPMDYWIRLNKSIDVADECLRRHNKSVEDPAAEAVMMFISHCPDPSLALSFQFKPAEKWSAAEVQERLDSHQRDLKRVSSRKQHAMSLSASNQCTVMAGPNNVPSSLPQPVSMTSSPQQPVSMPAQSLTPVSPLNPYAVPFSPDTSLQHIVGMMDRVLSLCTASLTSPSQVHPGKTPDFKTNLSTACRVCRSKEHTTYEHCRRQRLCRLCFSPGHFKSDCPKAACLTSPSDTAQLN